MPKRYPSVSVAMATCNGEPYITAQLQSLARQTRPPDEVVICDDQSSDRTLECINDFIETAPFKIRLEVNSQRLGYRKNFIHCASLCAGDIIFFCDQDDVWHEDKVRKVCEAFAGPDVLLVYHDAYAVDESLNILGEVYGSSGAVFTSGAAIHPWRTSLGLTQAFSRTLLDYNPLAEASLDHNQSGILAHDQWYWFLAGLLGKIVYTPEKLAFYRQHDRNVEGWRRTRSSRERAITEIRRSEGYELFVAASANRIELIEQLKDMPAARLDKANLLYRRAHVFYQKRRALYRDRSAASRLARLLGLVVSGGYIQNRYDKYALFRDVTLGLPHGPNVLDDRGIYAATQGKSRRYRQDDLADARHSNKP